jgi:undecaprenyl diphosphate synthase
MKDLLERSRNPEPDGDLLAQLEPDRLPTHVAIIMDGNGRWARRRNLPRVAGHKAGIDSVRMSVETCAKVGIQALTLYAFSIENWKRPRAEVTTLWRLLRVYLRKELSTLLDNGIRLCPIGRLDQLPDSVRRDLDETVRATSSGNRMQLNLAINYSGRAEIVDAFNRILEEARRAGTLETLNVDEDAISCSLYTAGLPEPDLLIRTSGEMRVSNFLLWQIAYAELYVTETLWPDFTRDELVRALLEYQRRERRFGGLADAVVSAPDSNESHLVGVAHTPSK